MNRRLSTAVHRTNPLLTLMAAFLLASCQQSGTDQTQGASSAPTGTPEPMAWEGTWRAVLTSPGGELPFTLEIEQGEAGLAAWVITGPERLPFSGVGAIGNQLVLRFDWYDAEITATRNGDRMVGEWRKTAAGGIDSTLPFAATRGDDGRFLPREALRLPPGARDALASVSGEWAVTFTEEDGSIEQAVGDFAQQGEQVLGTFLTPTGDYRFLEGRYEDGLLRLSTFDGAHAFLFEARAQIDGTLIGDFWSRDTYHATWKARPVTPGEEILPDAWKQAKVTSEDGRFRFDFETLDGNRLTHDDPRFDGKVVLVNLFGTWCPNCADEAPLLARWYERYRDRGLEVVGLAFEYTGDIERDREMIRRYAQRHGAEYPLLLAGLSDKADAASVLPDLDRVVAYPTNIFIGRDGVVRKVHSGFTGPGTGERFEALVREFEGTLESLLAEPAP